MPPSLPSKSDILRWLEENPDKQTRRDIARAFGIRGRDKSELKHMVKTLRDEGALPAKSTYSNADLPPVTVLTALPPDESGNIFAHLPSNPATRALIIQTEDTSALEKGARILAKITKGKAKGAEYSAKIIRVLPKPSENTEILTGVFFADKSGGGVLHPTQRTKQRLWYIPKAQRNGAMDGDLVRAKPLPERPRKKHCAQIISVTGHSIDAGKNLEKIAIENYGLPSVFPAKVETEAKAIKLPDLQSYTDLTHLPFITIDPADARDHDDAVYAQSDPDNSINHLLWVAIADVAAFVRPGSALDEEALKRANSVYFPSMVLPMLPEALSAELCSLHEGKPRPTLTVCLTIGPDGQVLAHKFCRAVISVRASLSYEQAQAAADGKPDDITSPLMTSVIEPLYATYARLVEARERRQPLDIDLPERQITLTHDGRVKAIGLRVRLEAHRLIEEAMVLANVAAGECLLEHGQTPIFRVHDKPETERVNELRRVALRLGLKLKQGGMLKPADLNKLLAQVAGSDKAETLNLSVLRTMAQAVYSTNNIGHFGLALRNYAHFTSPIRRYADLTIHRALIRAHGWEKEAPLEAGDFNQIADHISTTERRAMMSERETNDRYMAVFLEPRIGEVFEAQISSVTRFGLFVKILENSAEGLVPISSIGKDYFVYEKTTECLIGRASGIKIMLGQRSTVRLEEANPLTGGLIFSLLRLEGKTLSSSKTNSRGSAKKKRRRMRRP